MEDKKINQHDNYKKSAAEKEYARENEASKSSDKKQTDNKKYTSCGCGCE